MEREDGQGKGMDKKEHEGREIEMWMETKSRSIIFRVQNGKKVKTLSVSPCLSYPANLIPHFYSTSSSSKIYMELIPQNQPPFHLWSSLKTSITSKHISNKRFKELLQYFIFILFFFVIFFSLPNMFLLHFKKSSSILFLKATLSCKHFESVVLYRHKSSFSYYKATRLKFFVLI